jgi:hypothetical protein
MIQLEQELEENLIKPLIDLGYKAVNISNSEQLTSNLKNQPEKPEEKQNLSSENSQIPSFLSFIDEINVETSQKLNTKLPEDFATNSDNYLYVSIEK